MNKNIYRLDKNFTSEVMPHDLKTLKYLNQDIEALSHLYPEIHWWYWGVFAKGFAMNERKILFAKDNTGQLAGFSLLKNSYFEKKICTFYILPEFRESNLGTKFLPIAVDLVGGKDVGITVSEAVNKSLNPLLSAYDFEIENIKTGLYLPKNKEIFYKLC